MGSMWNTVCPTYNLVECRASTELLVLGCGLWAGGQVAVKAAQGRDLAVVGWVCSWWEPSLSTDSTRIETRIQLTPEMGFFCVVKAEPDQESLLGQMLVKGAPLSPLPN